MRIVTTTPPATEPVTLADCQAHSLIDEVELGAETELLESYLKAAREIVEAETRQRLIEQSVTLFCDGFANPMPLPIGPIQSIDQIEYLDTADQWQVVDPSSYRVLESQTPLRVAPLYGQVWPVPQPTPDNVRIDLTVGYASELEVPARMKQAIRWLFAHQHENRELAVTGTTIAEIPEGLQSILSGMRIWV